MVGDVGDPCRQRFPVSATPGEARTVDGAERDVLPLTICAHRRQIRIVHQLLDIYRYLGAPVKQGLDLPGTDVHTREHAQRVPLHATAPGPDPACCSPDDVPHRPGQYRRVGEASLDQIPYVSVTGGSDQVTRSGMRTLNAQIRQHGRQTRRRTT